MEEQITIIVQDEVGTRLDKYLAANLTGYTRSFIQKQIESESVLVNGKVVNNKYQVKYDDRIEITIAAPVEVDIVAENIPIDIIYEDENLLIINKPQNMVVHPAPGNYTGTLVNALLYHCKEGLSGINGEIRPGIVHRIDKDTSGLLMIAKNDRTHLGLSELLKDHDIIRKYQAIVYGKPKQEHGFIELPIARSPQDRKKMAVVQGGRHAKTEYRVLETFKNFSLVELTLYTGRTHQIRVHMKHIGHPLLGDPVYGPAKTMFGLTGQMLHAKVLGFKHPITGEEMYFESELPSYFQAVIDKLRRL